MRGKKQRSMASSTTCFLLGLVLILALCAMHDSNYLLSTFSYVIHLRRKGSEPSTTPPPVRLLLPIKQEMRKTTVAICALSKSKPTWQYVHDSSVYKLFLTGIYQTTHMQSQYDITVHVGVDTDDVFWSKKDNYNALVLASARDFNLKLTVYHYAKKQPNHLPMNELMRDAARTGAEYLVRLNDDTEIKSMSWLPLAVRRLSTYDPPFVGVVGPVCREGKTSILTHDMVHRTHLEIFDTYYPPNFHNWYVDDWISAVYGPERTTKIPDWVVHHYVSPPRYNPIMVSNETLQKSIQEGKDRIQAYLSRRNVSRKLSQVTLRVGHPRGGVGWQGKHSEKIRAYCNRDQKTSSYIQELIYPKDTYLDIGSRNDPSYDNTWRYLLSLHDPNIDSVVSKGILNWLFSTPGTYPSTTEVHTLCTAPIDGQPLINCESGKIAIEIGSAVGMVSAYLARRGMRVFAMDPVLPNIERLEETRCMNGMRQCLEQNEDIDCHNHSNWGQFTSDNFVLLNAVGGSKSNSKTTITSLANNLAATNPIFGRLSGRKEQFWSGSVSTLTVDDIATGINHPIELLHMCPQGSEWSILQGASHLIRAGLVRNILFGIYQNDASRQEQIEETLKIKSFLQGFGYQFYNLDGCGRGKNGVATGPPILLNKEEVVKYIQTKRYNGWHVMLLATLKTKTANIQHIDQFQASLQCDGVSIVHQSSTTTEGSRETIFPAPKNNNMEQLCKKLKHWDFCRNSLSMITQRHPISKLNVITEWKNAYIDGGSCKGTLGFPFTSQCIGMFHGHCPHLPSNMLHGKTIHRYDAIATTLQHYYKSAGHWPAEQLPSLLRFMKELDQDVKILVSINDCKLCRKYINELVRLGVLKSRDRLINWEGSKQDHSHVYFGKRVFHHYPWPWEDGQNPYRAAVLRGSQDLELVRSTFLGRIPEKIVPASDGKIVVIQRIESRRHTINHDKLVLDLRKIFSNVVIFSTPGDTLQEDVEVFRDASAVIAVHGAGLMNMLWCSPGTVVVEVCYTSGMPCPDMYYFMAVNLQLDYYVSVGSGDYDGGVSVDVADITLLLKKSLKSKTFSKKFREKKHTWLSQEKAFQHEVSVLQRLNSVTPPCGQSHIPRILNLDTKNLILTTPWYGPSLNKPEGMKQFCEMELKSIDAWAKCVDDHLAVANVSYHDHHGSGKNLVISDSKLTLIDFGIADIDNQKRLPSKYLNHTMSTRELTREIYKKHCTKN